MLSREIVGLQKTLHARHPSREIDGIIERDGMLDLFPFET